ncbi:MAG: hypothetical protein PHG69_04205, partial [Candidatus Omnitrophica bacterium]|nr:hypothetical protein [Candidatus Omnitrophota bacterium]
SKASLKIKDELFSKINPKSVAFIKDISYNQMACFIKRSQIYISFHHDFIYIALATKTPSLVISDDNVNQLLTLKNVATLALRDMPLSNKKANKKNRLTGIVEEKDIVMQTIDKLLQAK